MWVFTTYGFYSATRSTDEPEKIQIRARCREDLENLNERFGTAHRIIETPDSDYRFRVIVLPETWAEMMLVECESIDYGNFKNSLKSDQRDKPHMAIWNLMARFQRKNQGEVFSDESQED